MTDRAVHTVVLQTNAQSGKSETLLNLLGFHIEQEPAPILFVQPTLELAEAFSKDRVTPLLRDTETLGALMRDAGSTILHKNFAGGHVTLAGANSAASLASRPVRVVIMDEVDRYPPSAGAEGDPVRLARKRNANFHNRKTVLASTPTIKGASRIEGAMEESDMRRFLVPCPLCGEEQPLVWERVRWEEDAPATAKYHCSSCDEPWTEAQRRAAVKHGRWQAERVFTGIAGFHLSELYSPWATLERITADFLAAQRSRSQEQMRVWWNTTLGETFEDDGEHPEEGSLMARRESWEGTPQEVLFTTAGVDVQINRIQAELVGWGEDEESWSLAYATFWGDPATGQVWDDLDRWLLSMRPEATCIDSGHHTQQVYRFCAERIKRRVYAIKGMAGPGRLIWPRKASKPKPGVTLFIIGVDSAKDAIFSRLKIGRPGPGCCHFPRDRDDDWFIGLTSETLVVKYSRGFPVREYRKRVGIANEPLDCRVYAYAALCSFGKVAWKRIAKQIADLRAAAEEKEEAPQPAAAADRIPAEMDLERAPPARSRAASWRNWAPQRSSWMSRFK